MKMNAKKIIGVVIVVILGVIISCDRISNKERPNVLLITLDTTRADHLGCYGYERIETPVIDRLASDGVRFERVYASAPITLPNHSSILTGTHPLFHGARNNGTFVVDSSITTGAEIFSGKGYNTSAFIASFPLLARFGLDQGFKVYDDKIEEGKEKRTFLFQERRAEDVNKAVFRWLGTNPKTPYFTWVHYFDPHYSYDPPSPYKERYFANLYDGEIAYTDSQIGELLNVLNRKGLLENTMVVITADHGESLGEHKERTHAMLIYYGTVRVPLIIWYPNKIKGGKVIRSAVRSIDILPTVLDYAGIKAHPDIQGISLRPLIEGKKEDLNLVAYTETLAPYYHFSWSPLESVRYSGYLYIHAEPEELYDLNTDPQELNDLSQSEPKKLAQMRALYEAEKKRIKNPNELKSELKVDSETEERLRALGYIFGSTVEPKDGEHLKNPRFMVEMLENYFHGQGAVAAERYDIALKIFDEILEMEPNFGRAYLEKGAVYLRLREYQKSIENYNRAEELLPETVEIYLGRGQCYRALNDIAKAEEDFYHAIALDPSKDEAYIFLSRIKLSEKDFKSAHDLLIKAVQANYKSERAHLDLGLMYRAMGRYDDAKHELMQAKNANLNFALAPYMLAKLHYDLGEYEYAIENLEETLRRDPKSVQAHILLAQVLIDRDQLNRAQSHIDIALALHPEDDQAHFTLGNLLVKKGNFKDALKEFETAVKLNPKHALAYKNIGSISALTGNPRKALESYKKSLALMPKQPQAENLKAAIADLERMLSLTHSR